MKKVLISMPDELNFRMKTAIPARQRSKIIVKLIEKEIEKREHTLYKCALAVENNSELHEEMKDWDATLNDGLEEDESW